jgi:hypothetical protein
MESRTADLDNDRAINFSLALEANKAADCFETRVKHGAAGSTVPAAAGTLAAGGGVAVFVPLIKELPASL